VQIVRARLFDRVYLAAELREIRRQNRRRQLVFRPVLKPYNTVFAANFPADFVSAS